MWRIFFQALHFHSNSFQFRNFPPFKLQNVSDFIYIGIESIFHLALFFSSLVASFVSKTKSICLKLSNCIWSRPTFFVQIIFCHFHLLLSFSLRKMSKLKVNASNKMHSRHWKSHWMQLKFVNIVQWEQKIVDFKPDSKPLITKISRAHGNKFQTSF